MSCPNYTDFINFCKFYERTCMYDGDKTKCTYMTVLESEKNDTKPSA